MEQEKTHYIDILVEIGEAKVKKAQNCIERREFFVYILTLFCYFPPKELQSYKFLKYIATAVSCAYFCYRVNSIIKNLERDDASSLLLQNSLLYPISILALVFTGAINILSSFFEPFKKAQKIINNGPIAFRTWPNFDGIQGDEFLTAPAKNLNRVAFLPFGLLPYLYAIPIITSIDSYKLQDKSRLEQAVFIMTLGFVCLTIVVEEVGVLIALYNLPAKSL